MVGAITKATCRSCQAGRYSSGSGASQCTSCAPGTFATGTSMRTCYQCKGGSFQPNLGGSQCTLCALGRYATGRATTACLACGPGTAKPYTGSKYTCNICLGGTYQPARAASSCLPCTAGTYSTGRAATTCAPRPATDCNGTAGGAAVVGCDGVCGSGKSVGGCDGRCGSRAAKGCDGKCGSGRVRSALDPRRCLPCPGNATCPTPSPEDVVCLAGFYSIRPPAAPLPGCAPCPPGSTSPAGTTSPAGCACTPPLLLYGVRPSVFTDAFAWEPVCRPCPQHAAACPTASARDIACAAGYFFALDGQASVDSEWVFFDEDQIAQIPLLTCSACPGGTTSDQGSRGPSGCLCVFGTSGPPGGPCQACAPRWGGCSVPAGCSGWRRALTDQCIDGRPCGADSQGPRCPGSDYTNDCAAPGCANCSQLCPEGYVGPPAGRACSAKAGAACPRGSASLLGVDLCRCLPGLLDTSPARGEVRCDGPCPPHAECLWGRALCDAGYGLRETRARNAWNVDTLTAECLPCPGGQLSCTYPWPASAADPAGQARRLAGC